jgi:hypothetical protein
MSREDIHQVYEPADTELVELGVDHNGKKQWFMSTREGWCEVGEKGVLMLDHRHFEVGTKIELTNPSELYSNESVRPKE